MVVSSGLRSQHICPWGKTVLNVSEDNGETWSSPHVINDSPIDDRDAGLVSLGEGRLLLNWFASDTRRYATAPWVRELVGETAQASWQETMAAWTDELVAAHHGSWVRSSTDGGESWDEPRRVPVSAPHGPIRLRSGQLLYLGKQYDFESINDGDIVAIRSDNDGQTWQRLGSIPLLPDVRAVNYWEPHVIELPSGRLIGMVRLQYHRNNDQDITPAGNLTLSMIQSISDDSGLTWSTPRPLGFHGSPPHLFRHSSGALVLSYSYRQPPCGQRVALSYDNGESWKHDYILRDDGGDEIDLGYPSTVELDDASLLTVYYQRQLADTHPSLLWSRWRLP